MTTGADSTHTTTSTIVAPSLDPPPPYTEVGRRPRPSRLHRAHARLQAQAPASQPEQDTASLDEEPRISEQTPLLPSGLTVQYGPPTLEGISRAHSFASTTSGVPTLGQNVTALFRGDDMMDVEDILSEGPLASADDELASIRSSRRARCLSTTGWKLYFRPISRKAYYKAFFHLLVINFPYALAALLYLFVFTVTGTTLLIILPLGAVLCFLNLLGARALSRGELALQTRFHVPLHMSPSPPLPIFCRYREQSPSEAEENSEGMDPGLVRETSFYKNTFAMFTDPTSYQALFYFIVVKPAITLLITIGLLAIGVPLLILILPAPAVLRAVRKVGIWQANIAVEGLYLAVR